MIAAEPPVVTELPPLPRDCTFAESDWRVLANYWHPIARSGDVADKPVAARLLDQRLVIFGRGAFFVGPSWNLRRSQQSLRPHIPSEFEPATRRCRNAAGGR